MQSPPYCSRLSQDQADALYQSGKTATLVLIDVPAGMVEKERCVCDYAGLDWFDIIWNWNQSTDSCQPIIYIYIYIYVCVCVCIWKERAVFVFASGFDL